MCLEAIDLADVRCVYLERFTNEFTNCFGHYAVDYVRDHFAALLTGLLVFRFGGKAKCRKCALMGEGHQSHAEGDAIFGGDLWINLRDDAVSGTGQSAETPVQAFTCHIILRRGRGGGTKLLDRNIGRLRFVMGSGWVYLLCRGLYGGSDDSADKSGDSALEKVMCGMRKGFGFFCHGNEWDASKRPEVVSALLKMNPLRRVAHLE